MAERACIDVGAENFHDQQNCGEIYPGELCRGDTRDPIRVDISTTRNMGYGGHVCGSGEDDLGNLFSLSFLRKEKISPTHRRRSKYYAGQEIRIGTPELSDVSKI